MRTVFACIAIALFLMAGLNTYPTSHPVTRLTSRSKNRHPVRATARYAPWKICIDEATITRFVTNASLLLAADLLGDVTVGDAWNSYDDEGPSFKMLFNFMAGCAGMSVLFDRLVNSCPECPHCAPGSLLSSVYNFSQDAISGSEELVQEAESFIDALDASSGNSGSGDTAPSTVAESANSDTNMSPDISSELSANSQDALEDITPLHKTACLLYNFGKLVSALRLARTIYDVFAEDRDFGSKCVVTPAALIGMRVLLKDLHESYQDYKNSSGRYSKCMVS
jgi:hypothetical protein